MKFTRSRYPDYPGLQYSAPCWELKGRWLYADADWNTRFPFGVSLGFYIGPYITLDAEHGISRPNNGFCLDLNPPLGEPNRLYLRIGHWFITVGLISWWMFRETGRQGNCIEGEYVRCRPHLDGIDRYRYHKDSQGTWVRNDKPERLHWGWLTIERNRHDRRAPARVG